jgi:steroid delta-isomerase-like uncharacterized protein
VNTNPRQEFNMDRASNASDVSGNKALSIRFNEEVKNRHRLASIDELLRPEFVNHSPIPGFASTREGVKEFFSHFIDAFPDLSCTVHDMIAEGDRVVDRFTLAGTHRGAFMGIPATGRRVSFDGMHIFSFEKARIVGHWNVLDLLSLMTQLGAIPAQGDGS